MFINKFSTLNLLLATILTLSSFSQELSTPFADHLGEKDIHFCEV